MSVPKASASNAAEYDVGWPSEPSEPSTVTAIENARRRTCSASAAAIAVAVIVGYISGAFVVSWPLAEYLD